MTGAENFVGALIEMLEAYRLVTRKLIEKVNKLEANFNKISLDSETASKIDELKNKVNTLEKELKEKESLYEKKIEKLYDIEQNNLIGEINSEMKKIDQGVDADRSALVSRIDAMGKRLDKIEKGIAPKNLEELDTIINEKVIEKVPSVDEMAVKVDTIISSLPIKKMSDKINQLEAKIKNMDEKVPTIDEIANKVDGLVSNLPIDDLSNKLNQVEAKVDESKVEDGKKFDELYAIERSIPLSEMISRIENLEETLETKKKDYKTKFEELGTVRNDINIVSKELLEVKTLTEELTKVMSRIEVETENS